MKRKETTARMDDGRAAWHGGGKELLIIDVHYTGIRILSLNELASLLMV